MTKFRRFILKQFKTASALRIGRFQLGAHRCVWWGMPCVVITILLFSWWARVEEGYIVSELNPFSPRRFNQLTFWNNPEHWYFVMWFFCILSALYFYFVFIHFRIFPMTHEEWMELMDEGLIQLEGCIDN